MIATTLEKTRKSFTKMMREYEAQIEEPDHTKFRNMVYAYSTLLNFWKLEKDIELEKRLDEIEERLDHDK